MIVIIKSILIANRGEVAVRIIRACHEMNIKAIAVYSTADKNALFVREADQAIALGPSPVTDSYLNKSAILMAALLSGADAVHPGYGLLSEDWIFAKLCEDSGLKFIGPSSTVIKQMGNKINSRAVMQNAGVSVVPGLKISNYKELNSIRIAKELEFPVMLKSALGGGGKGIRKADTLPELKHEIKAVLDESKNAFGSSDLYIEQYMAPARHIEVQIIGDHFGNVRVLGERDCSIQRNHQKVIEQAPATILSDELRDRVRKQAVMGANEIAYSSLGTMEFLLYQNQLYFLEMNTRLQVEHTVTEEVSDLDLLKWQIRVANDEQIDELPIYPEENGVAIECRLTSEDPENSFTPSVGVLKELKLPTGGRNVRIDEGVQQGDQISPFYDSMIAKVIVRAENREQARLKMLAVLNEVKVDGVLSNLNLLKQILNDEHFIEDRLSTSVLEENILKVGGVNAKAS